MNLFRSFLAVALLLVASVASAATFNSINVSPAQTDVITYVTLSSTAGDVSAEVPLTNIAYNAAGLDVYYVRDGGALTQITLATQTVNGAHADGGFIKLSDTLAAGRYRLDLPDAVCASGVSHAMVYVSYNDVQIADLSINIGDAYKALTAASSLPAQGAPSATASVSTQINWLYKAWRNRSTFLADGSYRLYNDDATTVDSKATIKNVQGRGVVERGEVATGP